MISKARFSDEQIRHRIDGAPRLASLRSIGAALTELVYAENSFTSQIAEVIRRDPSLTSRLLKLVNSVFFGLSQRVNNIEEAIFYLGLRQIRELAVATPVIEDFDRLRHGVAQADWRCLWRQSIGCGILTREILSSSGMSYEDDTDYIVGLIHKVGKIVMASTFPDEFAEILEQEKEEEKSLWEIEEELIGWDHARVGAYFLERHHLGDEIVIPVRWQNAPDKAGEHARAAAAIQIASAMVEVAETAGEDPDWALHRGQWMHTAGWEILFGHRTEDEMAKISEDLEASLGRLPRVLNGMV